MYQSRGGTWGIILSGGDGRRLHRFTESLYGYKRPKQYCAIVGTRSMLRHTINRAERLISARQLLTIIDRSHLPIASVELRDRPAGTVIVQPCNRDTAPGILHSVLRIYRNDPDAVVMIFPSDHFIIGEDMFMEQVGVATTIVKSHPGTSILLGVASNTVELSYGYVEPGVRMKTYRNANLFRIGHFWEKPGDELARSLHNIGCLWNTMILVSHVSVLRDLFRLYAPEIHNQFRKVEKSFGSSREADIIEEAYGCLPSANFSSTILEPAAKRWNVFEVDGAYWSDWGDEGRIRLDVQRFNLHLNEVQRTVEAVTASPPT